VYQQKFLCPEVPCVSGDKGEGHVAIQDPFQYKNSDGWHGYQQNFLGSDELCVSEIKGEGQESMQEPFQ